VLGTTDCDCRSSSREASYSIWDLSLHNDEVMLRETLGGATSVGVALARGEPTRDPAAARRGALLPFGGYKVSACAHDTGAATARRFCSCRATTAICSSPSGPDLFGPADAFERQVTQLIERIKATPRQPGVDDNPHSVRAGIRSRERATPRGLEIDRVVFDALVALRAR